MLLRTAMKRRLFNLAAAVSLGMMLATVGLWPCCGAVASAAPTDEPALTVDLRATSTTSGTVLDPKHVVFTGGVGDSVTMDLYYVITGYSNSDPFDDYFGWLHGSLLSSNGGLRGDLTAHVAFEYQDTFGFSGFRQDLDGDGDLDVGSNNNATLSNFLRAYVGESAPSQPEDKFATVTWVRTGNGTDTLINFRPRLASDAAGWVVDGHEYHPPTGVYTSGADIQISLVPEPTAVMPAVLAIVCCITQRRHGTVTGTSSKSPLRLRNQ